MTSEELDATTRDIEQGEASVVQLLDLVEALRTAWAERDARPDAETVAQVRECLEKICRNTTGEGDGYYANEALRLLEGKP